MVLEGRQSAVSSTVPAKVDLKGENCGHLLVQCGGLVVDGLFCVGCCCGDS